MPGVCEPPRPRVQGLPASRLMRLLADENFPLPTIEALQQAGHDVTWARTDHTRRQGCRASGTRGIGSKRCDARQGLLADRDPTPPAPRTKRLDSLSGPSGDSRRDHTGRASHTRDGSTVDGHASAVTEDAARRPASTPTALTVTFLL